MSSVWPQEKIWKWYNAQPWLVGCNFLPSSAINQLEMFQPDSFDRPTLNRELDWAAGLGMNSLRVFLHDLLWQTSEKDFFKILDEFLDMCAARKIVPMLVFFDDCHRPEPKAGKQPAPIPSIHNSGWAQSPGVPTLTNPREWRRLEKYVKATLKQFGKDERILCWDLFNEPCNNGFDGNKSKTPYSVLLLKEVFGWAREINPMHPITVGTWNYPHPYDVHDEEALEPHIYDLLVAQRFAIANSDLITYHNYGSPESQENQIVELKKLGRPFACTEYMARTINSTFHGSLPIFKREKVGAYNWGFVAGKSNTIYPWGTPEGAPEPKPWFHDIYRVDGTPFDTAEVELFRSLTGVKG